MGERPFCVKGGEIIGNVPTIAELAVYIKDYILNDAYGAEWVTDNVRGATRQAVYNMHQQVVGQLEYKGLWDASSENYPEDPELGWYYVTNVAGVTSGVRYEVGDWIIWNGSGWDKLAGKSDNYPMGFQGNYFGTGIKGNLETRDYEISVANGDDFDMLGWFVANGMVDTPNCIDRFMQSGIVSGSIGGDNNAVVVEHNHLASQVEHTHELRANLPNIGEGGPLRHILFDTGTYYDGYTSGEQPAITVDNEGVDGGGKNKPKFITSIPIIKMG